jgi:transposase
MGKRFRTDFLDQALLLPPSLHDWLPEGHLARFIADVIEELDLGAVYESYAGDGRGLAAYQPAMMVRLLLYGYCLGVVSSRKIERATYEDVAFRFLSVDAHPDHDTIAAFRKRHLEALAGLFVQALRLCEKAGLVKLGHVAIDGTKLKANASKHKAMSYERMGETEQRLRQEVDELLRSAAEVDEAEDAQYGKGQRGDELPAELARRESRLVKIRAAKAELEREAKEKAERQRVEAEAKLVQRREQEARTGKKAGGHDPKVPDPEQAKPEPKAQRNFTDPDSRIMVDREYEGVRVRLLARMANARIPSSQTSDSAMRWPRNPACWTTRDCCLCRPHTSGCTQWRRLLPRNWRRWSTSRAQQPDEGVLRHLVSGANVSIRVRHSRQRDWRNV